MPNTLKKPRPLASRLLEKAARKRGFRVVVEPSWGIVLQIGTGTKKRYLRYSSIDINGLGAAEVVKDKDYANFFMKKMGYPIVPGRAFYSPEWAKVIGSKESTAAAYAYAKKLGFPVFVKPNSGAQGRHIARVETKKEFDRALREIFAHDRVALVQRPVKGRDYRIVVLDTQVVCAYERMPFSVIGDGHRSLLKLIEAEVARRRDTTVHINARDARIREKLARQGLSLRSIPAKGTHVELLDVANLSAGGSAREVTDTLHPKWKEIAVHLAADMGLRFAGIDLMIPGDAAEPSKNYSVLEVNASPGLDNYAALGKTQMARAEKLYERILTYLS